ncbi:DUF2867 domain-containing protein [Hasllibacter sp. MH4015]|uniref:DUF2867 domain-containing protein n=1 Tax=Hasllibacter sp. MH4015 TaxID=2854029 RepID=UPI001CD52BA5|nr:DUF2867 domain-containing protein [Hasllibacter sp. MH4015]
MSGLKRPLRPPDWSDTHRAEARPDLTSARAAYEVALGTMPPWVRRAMGLRNRIVHLFGLATPTMEKGMADLPIVAERPKVYEVGLADRHLTFTLETRLEDRTASLTTRIWFNHWTGRLYLAVVLIPHKIIVRSALRRLA